MSVPSDVFLRSANPRRPEGCERSRDIPGSHVTLPLQNVATSRNLERGQRRQLCSASAAAVGVEDRLDISVRKRSEVQVVQLQGPLRLGAAVDGLRQVMEEAIANGDTRMILNLAGVTIIDSSGIGLLVKFLAKTKQLGGNIKLVQPNKFAIQTLKLVGVLNLFEIFDDDDTAVLSFA